MRVHILDADANRFQNLYFTREEDWNRLEGLDGSPLGDEWSPVVVQISPEHRDRPPSDFPNFQGVASACVFSARAVEALGDLLEGRGELLPLEADGSKYFLFNITRLTDALDEEATEFRVFKSSGRVMKVKRYAFDSDRLASETIFKLAQLLNCTAT